MFFVSWGKKVRVRSLGDRAEFCPGCLQATRFTVKRTLTANHLYGIPLGYSQGMTFGECCICGAQIEPMFDDALVPTGTLSFESMLAQTNPRLTTQRIETLQEVAGDSKSRLEQSLRYFLSKQEILLAAKGGEIGGGTLFAILTAFVLAFCAFHRWGVVVGSASVLLACLAVVLVHRLEVCHRAARVILPNLKKFLASHGISFDDLQRKLQTEQLPFRRLNRHLASSPYRDLEMSPPPGDVAGLFFGSTKQANCA